MLISERLWIDRYERDPLISQQRIYLDDEAHAIIGVLPASADFGVLQVLTSAAYARSFADRGQVAVDIWRPMRPDAATASRDNHPIFMMGRLADDVPLEAAQGEMARISADLERTYPRSNVNRGSHVESFDAVVLGPVRPTLYVLLTAVGLVLLVACVNVVNLLLVQAAGRVREVAVRTALGAGTARLLRQFLVEGMVLSAGAAALGLVLAGFVLDLLVALAPANLPRLATVAINQPVLLVTSIVALGTALGAGLVPALATKRLNVQQTLKSAGGRAATGGPFQRRMQSSLVVVQVALAVVLVIGAGLLVRSFWKLQALDPGFTPDGVLKAEFQLPESRYPHAFQDFPNWPEVRRFYDELLQRTAQLPDVEAVALSSDHPLAAGSTNSFVVVGRELEARTWPEISVRFVSGGYARVSGLALLSGRHVADADGAETPPVLAINETARRMFFGDRDPLGQQLAFWGAARTIVGVVADEKMHGLEHESPPAAYLPYGQMPLADVLLVRTSGRPSNVAADIRAVVREIDPALALFGVEPLSDTVSESLRARRFAVLLLGGFALLTLVLAALGLYGLLSHGVAQRSTEIGIRLALGAQPGSVRRLVIGQGLILVVAGLALGLAGAVVTGHLLAAMLFGTATTDVATFVTTPVILLAAAALACYLPARRASRIEPATALRTP